MMGLPFLWLSNTPRYLSAIHPLRDTWLIHSLAIVNGAAVKLGVQVSFS